MNATPHRTVQLVGIGIALFLAGLILGRYFVHAHGKPGQELHYQSGHFSFINPLLACGEFSDVTPRETRATKEAVEAYIARQEREGKTAGASVYFRDLNNGPWFEVNGEEKYTPGSLLKVPLLMSLYSAAVRDPSILEKEFAYSSKEGPVTPQVLAPSLLVDGTTYPLSAFADAMIRASDNNAMNQVYQALGPLPVNATYRELGLATPEPMGEYEITANQYATFFRLLFNATYLTPEYSEKALDLLSRSEFKDGIVAGVPDTVTVAHKFGEREIGATTQLHDCGIVYAKDRPYTLCVMTRGRSLTDLTETIEGISRIVYNGVRI